MTKRNINATPSLKGGRLTYIPLVMVHSLGFNALTPPKARQQATQAEC